MKRYAAIRILEEESNQIGDLFARLMADVFVAMGYEQPRLNIHKSGREVDISVDHRLEHRSAIGECKATSTPIGGDEINKFVGVVDAERRRKVGVTGYFISLAGFRESAIEQEKQGRRTPIVLLDGGRVVSELIKGRIIIPKEKVTELAGRYCAVQEDMELDDDLVLLAHKLGWIWCVYYLRGKARAEYVLIHADGTLLSRTLVDEVVRADRVCGGDLPSLSCLNPAPVTGVGNSDSKRDALSAYERYLEAECGYIQLDGLPTDNDIGSRRLRLENLFVPLHLDIPGAGGPTGWWKLERQPVGAVIGSYRLALLAQPGGGKSTFLKRLAIAYINPGRGPEIDDHLPYRNWFPLFFRCRELRDQARRSFADLLIALSQREPVRQHAGAFLALVDMALLEGRVLLLVDGLDEISDPGDRAAFVCTLRTTLQAYPQTACVITSREAGFRHVASHLAPVCTQAKISSFDRDDIRRLTVAWHREVVGDTTKVRLDAEELAATISRNSRIQQLATNPLLLTTLLLVKRWVGSLPTRRAVLYGKAVEVLLMTWNTEGHDPIPQEDALPQLCYIAAAMMFAGMQSVSRPTLATLLQDARDSLPSELGYVQGTVDQFIHRVEDRSSLLMMTGFEVESSHLVEMFEFRHLTFQEYLAALALVRGWYPGFRDSDTLLSALKPFLGNPKWSEVIPLAAVLGGKETEALIQHLTELVGDGDAQQEQSGDEVFLALGSCLSDEAPARPETIRAAVAVLVRRGESLSSAPFMPILSKGRYGPEFKKEARRSFHARKGGLVNSSNALTQVVWGKTLKSTDGFGFADAANTFVDLLNSPRQLDRCEGALGVMYLCLQPALHRLKSIHAQCVFALQRAGPALAAMILSDVVLEQATAAWALARLGPLQAWVPPADMIVHLCRLWLDSHDEDVRHMAAFAFITQPLLSREEVGLEQYVTREQVRNSLKSAATDIEMSSAVVAAWYTCALSDVEIAKKVIVLRKNTPSELGVEITLRSLSAQLSDTFNLLAK